MFRLTSLPIRALFAALAMTSVIALPACGGSSDSEGGKLALVAYSTPQAAYEEIIPAFAKTAEGKGTSFDQSYGSSGEQERAIEGGLTADVAALSLEPDIDKLVKAGLVEKSWNASPSKGIVTNSVVVFAVRKGNPRNIRTYDDLIKPGVEVITSNPFTSGGARWNVMAAYGAQLEQGKSEDEAIAYLKKLFANVSVQDKSAREALQTFAGGKGDVLIAYENEAITAQQKGEDLDYVIPAETILIENPVAVVKASKHLKQATAFVDYLRTPAAQRVFADKGYRSIIKNLVDEQEYPTPQKLFTIGDVGGWPEVQEKFFDPENGIQAKINREQGVDAK